MENTTTKRKWFYKGMDEIAKRVDASSYSRAGYTNWQSFDGERYFENFDLRDAVTGNVKNVTAIYHKETEFLFFYEAIPSTIL